MKLVGRGLIVDTGRELAYPEWGDVEIDFGLPCAEAPALAAGEYAVPPGAAFTGRIVWYELTADLLAVATGEAPAAGTVKRAEAEPYQVPSAPPYEVELAEAAVVPLSEFVVGDDNERLRPVAAEPGPGEYRRDGGRLTLNVSHAGRYVYVDYFFREEGTGKTLILPPFAAPGEFKLWAALKLNDAAAHLYEREMVLAAACCRRTGPLGWEAGEEEFGAFGFAFAAENRSPGEVVAYFP
ncbi:MAG: hypothetical protein JSU81_06115 [Candidatus Coatesbacteria bacterium]|nr:MAG: hypothetical protein JSU81_06115 [Candidatus Coatesbacteria bacterium]